MTTAITKQDIVHTELARIASEHGGKCIPAVVVKEARPKRSPLHPYFQWDDSKAAAEYRLWQARELIIRVAVEYADVDTDEVRVFVSQTSDRKEKAGGYRVLADVLSDEERRAELLVQAAGDFRRFKASFVRRYTRLPEFEDALASMERLIKRYLPQTDE